MQTLSGSLTFGGTTTVNAGTLTLDYSSDNDSKLSDFSALNLAGGTLNLSGGSHTEVVALTTLAAGTASTVSRGSGNAILQMGLINRLGNATINFAQSGIARTDTLNNADGYIGAWATVNGTDLAVNSTNDINGLITLPAYVDVTRLSSGSKTIANDSTAIVRIIEGTGSAGNITLASAVTSAAAITQSAVGGTSPAIIDPAGQTLATNTIFAATPAGALTIGTGTNNGSLQTTLSGGDLSVNNLSSNSVTINSVIADNGLSTVSNIGTGNLVLNGNNLHGGGTVLASGTLTLGNAGALGLGDFTIQGGTLESSVANLVNANGNTVRLNGDFAFAGTDNLDFGTSPVTTSGARVVSVNNRALTFGGAMALGGNLTKAGNGTLVLNGSVPLATNRLISVSNGTLAFGGALTATSTEGFGIFVGNAPNASSAMVQTGGSVSISGSDRNNTFNVGNATTAPGGATGASGGFGSYTMAGGSLDARRINIAGGDLATSGTNGIGLFTMLNGATAKFFNFFIGGRGSATNTGVATIAGGALDLTNSVIQTGAFGGGRFEVNLGANLGGSNTGGTFNATNRNFSAVASTASSQGIVNLLGGTLIVNSISSPAGISTGTGINQFNFNGGMLKYSGTAALATFLNAIPAGEAGTSGVFVRSGGFVLDNNDQAVTIAAALLAPTGGEIKSISVTGAGAPGTFLTPPHVRITGGNNDATAIAKIKDDGSLDSVIVTNPGSGYTANPPTVTLVGGTNAGGSTAVTGAATAVVGGSTSGGFTKKSANYVTFSGDNTYSGVTTIEAGSITLNSAIPNPNTSYDVKSGAQAFGGWAVPGATFPNNFTIAGSGFAEGGINTTALRSSNNQIFTGTITLAASSRIGMIEGTASATFSGKITGNFDLGIQGAFNANSGTQTFTLANTGAANDYAGNTSVFALDYIAVRTGVATILRLGANEQIPHGEDKGNLLLNGPNADHITVLELNGFSETINGLSNDAAAGAIVRNTATGASTLTIGERDASSLFSGVMTDGGAAKTLSINKVGTGILTLAGLNSYTGDTVVSDGTLELADDAQLKFVLGTTSGVNNSISGSGVVVLNGDFVIDTTAADTLASGSWTLENVSSLTGAYGETFSVVGFNDAGSHKWTKTVGSKKYTFDETTGVLTLETSGYASWATLNGAGPNLNDDHDNDGVRNGVEYFLGGPNGNTTGFTALPGVTNTAGTLSVTWVMGSGYAGVYGTDFTVETSDTLTGTWATESSPGTVAISGSNVTYTYPAPLGSKKFTRLKVTGP
jgi:autotransporter-associated beta strand protein